MSHASDAPEAPLVAARPEVCAGAPCIAGTRIPVATLVACRDGGWDDATILRNYPTLRPEHLAAAWVYAVEHPAEPDVFAGFASDAATVVIDPSYCAVDVRLADGSTAPFTFPPDIVELLLTVHRTPAEAVLAGGPMPVAMVYLLPLHKELSASKLELTTMFGEATSASAPPVRVLFAPGDYLDLPETTRCVSTHTNIHCSEAEQPLLDAEVEVTVDGCTLFPGAWPHQRVATLADYLTESTTLLFVEVLGQTRWRLGRTEPLDRTVRRLWAHRGLR